MEIKEKSIKPFIAGVLLIISGLLAILVWLSLFSNNEYILFGIIGIIISIFPIIAGVFSIKRKYWTIALIFSIIGLFTILTPIIISGVLASLGFILIVISKREFS